MASYGISYQGSKNAIAEFLISRMPKADVFVDLFCGGCSMTHCAVESGKYNRFIINDIDDKMPYFFKDSVEGKFNAKIKNEWITREKFFAEKENDIYIKRVWSFGNDGSSYLYGEDLEPIKKALHYAVFNNDVSLIKQYIDLPDISNISEPAKRMQYIKNYVKTLEFTADSDLLKVYTNLERSAELERLERLNGLATLNKKLLHRLEIHTGDYRDVKIPDNALIYCDIPYKNTGSDYVTGFEHNEFYEWARKQDNIYISEYNMPDDFIDITKKDKSILCTSDGNGRKALERLFVNKLTYEKFNDTRKDLIENDFATQMSFDDLL